MWRTKAVSVYGWRTALSGTLFAAGLLELFWRPLSPVARVGVWVSPQG